MNRFSPTTRRWLYSILGVGLLLHLASAFIIYAMKPESISTTPDPLDYRLAALNLLDHHEFSFAGPEFHAPQLLRTPGYPLLLAGTYALDGRTGLAMVLVQSVLLVGMAFLLFLLLKRFQVSDTVALILIGAYVFEPLQWLYTLLTMTETIASFLILVLLVLALTGRGVMSYGRAAAYGALLGFLILIKPSATMWFPFLLIAMVSVRMSAKERIVRAVVAVICALIVLSPWVARNHHLTGHFIISSSGPFNFILFAGTPETTPSSYYDVITTATYNGHSNNVWYAYTAAAYLMLQEAQKNILAHSNYLSFITRQIRYAPYVWFGFIHPTHEEAYGHEYSLFADLAIGTHAALDAWIDRLDTAIWAVVLLLTGLGSALLFQRKEYLTYGPILLLLLVTVFLNFAASWTRMLLPIYPAVWIATGVGITWLLARMRLSNSRVS